MRRPAVRILLEAAVDQRPDGVRYIRRQQLPVGIGAQDRRDRVGDVISPEWTLAGQHFEKHDPERPDVRTPIDLPPARLLRAHVGGGAEDHSCGGHGRRRQRRRVLEIVRGGSGWL
jgi:hypothetical protein